MRRMNTSAERKAAGQTRAGFWHGTRPVLEVRSYRAARIVAGKCSVSGGDLRLQDGCGKGSSPVVAGDEGG
jgi:hypothetical protein